MTPDQELESGRLMACAQQGDLRCVRRAAAAPRPRRRGFVGRRVGWTDWVEDVVQDALLTVHRARHTYDPARPFAPWFYTIVSSRLVDALRARKRLSTREVADGDALDRQPAPAIEGGRHDVSEQLARAVSNLPRVQREVVSLLKYDDLSVRDVAQRLGMSEAAVKTTAHRGYKILRRTVGGIAGEDRRVD